MRLITEKKKFEIGKKLSAIYYIAVHGYGHGIENDLDAMNKIVELVHDIAYEVGGDRFAHIDIPAYVHRLNKMRKEKENEQTEV